MNAVRSTRLAALVVAGLWWISPVRAADLFVDAASGADSNDGLSWATAKATVTAALAAAAGTIEPDVVTVASGDYRELITMPPGVTLIGSVPAGGGPQDVMAHPSVLDAEYRGRVVYFGSGADGSILDGFVVTRGYLNDPASDATAHGAGINVTDAGVIIRNCRIEGNQAVGVAAISANVAAAPPGTPATRVENCLIRRNRQFGIGCSPFVYLWCNSVGAPEPLLPLLKNVVVEDNERESDCSTGAVSMRANETVVGLENVIVRRNSGRGMSLSLQDGASLLNCEASDNAAGGVMFDFGGAQPWGDNKPYTIINCTFRAGGFPAFDGGQPIPESGGALEMRRCILAGDGQDVRSSGPGEGPGTIFFTRPVGPAIVAVMDNLILRAPSNLLPTNIDADPLFASGPLGSSYLSQLAAGQLANSLAVDEGDVMASDVGMDGLTTRTDSVTDTGACDLGVHYGFAPEPPPFIERFRIFVGQDRSSLELKADGPERVWMDVPGALSDSSRPLIFYEVEFPSPPLMVTKHVATDTVRLVW